MPKRRNTRKTKAQIPSPLVQSFVPNATTPNTVSTNKRKPRCSIKIIRTRAYLKY